MEQGLTRETIYARLRELEISPEVSDITAELLESYSDKKVEALLLWLRGYNEREISKVMGMSRTWAYEVLDRMISYMVKSKNASPKGF